jgi:hypothetical protein
VLRTLKRATPSSATFDFLFRALGDQSELSKMFLLTCLISVYTLKPTGTSFEKWSKNVDFSETRFSHGIGVGLRLYTDYMISKNGYDWFHQVLTCFALIMDFLEK